MPKTIHAVAIDHTGGPEVLSIYVLPVPSLTRTKCPSRSILQAWAGGMRTYRKGAHRAAATPIVRLSLTVTARVPSLLWDRLSAGSSPAMASTPNGN
jgi:hypothetical protein